VLPKLLHRARDEKPVSVGRDPEQVRPALDELEDGPAPEPRAEVEEGRGLLVDFYLARLPSHATDTRAEIARLAEQEPAGLVLDRDDDVLLARELDPDRRPVACRRWFASIKTTKAKNKKTGGSQVFLTYCARHGERPLDEETAASCRETELFPNAWP